MKLQEIKALGINSSREYHSYLSENNRGIEVINVTSIAQKKDKIRFLTFINLAERIFKD